MLRLTMIIAQLALVSATVWAQHTFPVTNLGAGYFVSSDDWYVYNVAESFAEQDLNGDGDRDDEVVQVRGRDSAEVRNLALAGWNSDVNGEWVCVIVDESQQGVDLNGDGDQEDFVPHVYNLESRDTTNLTVAVWEFASLVFRGRWLTVHSYEFPGGDDVNEDGDLEDSVLLVHDLSSGETVTLVGWDWMGITSDNRLVLAGIESQQGTDLNGDGDQDDRIVHLFDPLSGAYANLELAMSSHHPWFCICENLLVRVDMDDDNVLSERSLLVHDLTSGETEDLGVYEDGGFSHEQYIVFQGEDLNIYDLVSREMQSLPMHSRFNDMESGSPRAFGDWLVLFESWSQDVYLHRLSTGETVDLGFRGNYMGSAGNRVVFHGYEAVDLNDDGDTEDHVFHILDLSSRETSTFFEESLRAGSVDVFDVWLFVYLEENGVDINQDGDSSDILTRGRNLSTGESILLEGVDRVVGLHDDRWVFSDRDFGLHVYDRLSRETVELGLAAVFARIQDGVLIAYVVESRQGRDLNADGDTEDQVVHLVDLRVERFNDPFRRGDTNADGALDIADAIFSLTLQR